MQIKLNDVFSELDPSVFNGRKFACLVAIEVRPISLDHVERLCRRLLELGCVWFSAWGTECERVHDIMDYVVVERDRGDVITTWHADESLDEAMEFFLSASNADYDAVIISIGSGQRTITAVPDAETISMPPPLPTEIVS